MRNLQDERAPEERKRQLEAKHLCITKSPLSSTITPNTPSSNRNLQDERAPEERKKRQLEAKHLLEKSQSCEQLWIPCWQN
eukprot:scaffold2957_cov232-Chaetoceros_neogracile.AAC.14